MYLRIDGIVMIFPQLCATQSMAILDLIYLFERALTKKIFWLAWLRISTRIYYRIHTFIWAIIFVPTLP